MPFLILGSLLILISLFIDKPKTNMSAISLGFIVTYIVLYYQDFFKLGKS
jgi:hypothetical protein